MRNIREVLRLHLGQCLPQRVIAQSLRLGLGTVNGYVGRARRARLQWPLPDGLDDDRLEALLFPTLARLRHRAFLSLAELNTAIAALVEQLNDRTMRG